MKRVRQFVADHPKLSAGVATAVIAGAAYYGVPPEVSQAVLAAIFGGQVFLDPLQVQLVDDSGSRPVWRLLAPLRYRTQAGVTISVPAGFVTDLASVPRLPLAWLLAGGTANAPAVVHDYLYQTHALPRDEADAIFEEAMEASGVPGWRRALMWSAVRAGGWHAYGRNGTRAAELQALARDERTES